jgi:hypothetical protein
MTVASTSITRRGQCWTLEEYATAEALKQNGMSLADIARAVGRTPDGVESRLRLGPSRRERHAWTPEEIALCVELRAQGLPPRLIALRLPADEAGRRIHSAQAISAKLADLRRTATSRADPDRQERTDRALMAWALSLPWRADARVGADAQWWPR